MSDDRFPLDIPAYVADTAHLCCEEHGAYLLILMALWRCKGWLRDDEQTLANVTKLSRARWRKIAPTIRALLQLEDGKVSQKRLLSERENSSKTSEKNRANGRNGGIAKSLKTKKPDVATATVSPAVRQNGESGSYTPLLDLDSDSEVGKERKGRAAGRSLPSDWVATEADVAYGREVGLTDRQVEHFAEDMRLWARANSNRAVGRKADWTATFRGWLRREAGKRGPRPNGGGQGGGSGPRGKRTMGDLIRDGMEKAHGTTD